MSKLLIVDDQMGIRDMCYDLFKRSGHTVLTAARGDQALAMIGSEKPDLVMMDLQIPGEERLSLLNKIRGKFPSVAVAIFSGSVTPEIEKQAYEIGALEVIHKNVGVTELKERIEKILASKRRPMNKPSEAAGEKILVVDDEDPIRNLIVDYFTKKGFRAFGARSGEEALVLVQKEKPAVVLLDMIMPGMDGLLTLKKIREIDRNVGVVMATGVRDEEIAREATALGAYHYVLKPFDLKYLELVVVTRLVVAS